MDHDDARTQMNDARDYSNAKMMTDGDWGP
jgi:hypothetical protein